MYQKEGIISLLLFVMKICLTYAEFQRPRGVSLDKAPLYHPRNDGSWICLDNTKTLRFDQINDDYCDCEDGSDEPGTAACSGTAFHCTNTGYKSIDIPSSRVNDGVCDCCDGTDEYGTLNIPAVVACQNTCEELGRIEKAHRKNEMELHKKGSSKRAEIILKGKQLRTEREARRLELESRRLQLEAIKVDKEELKRSAEAAEGEALEVYKLQQREHEVSDVNKSEDEQRTEAHVTFQRYDVNRDGFVEVAELQVDMSLDRDKNGVVTVEEAKYFLDERDRVDQNAFTDLSWPRIKPVLMLAEGFFKAPIAPTEHEDVEEADTLENVHSKSETEKEHISDEELSNDQDNTDDYETEEDHEGYENDDADVGAGTVTEDHTFAPEYDPETQRLIKLANEARSAHAEIEREIREVENEIKEIDEQNSKDYGDSDEFAFMDGECYKYEDREYIYTLCPFDRTSQKQQSGGGETTLGRWDQWLTDGDKKYTMQKYSNGASCWNGPQRSVIVHLKCALENRIISVSEPNRCEYYFEFETPAACSNTNLLDEDDMLHDEL